ncbi:MAG: LysR family transcriptional regulator [Lachnospiraceae bacterium]|nr:LysR family transcriptional regulator [Lachnospiraceae bacterium]
MTIRHLHIFLEVCYAESITLAAERLNMAQPAVSTAIRELEQYYGVRLFDRMNRRIYITQAGTMLMNYANSILSQMDEVKHVIGETSTTGTLRIGSNIAFAVSYLADIIADFCQIHPAISVYTRIQSPRNLEDGLLHNELDFAIADRLTSHGAFHYQKLTQEEMRLVCSPDLAVRYLPGLPITGDIKVPITLAQLTEMPLLLREIGSGSRDHMDLAFRSANLSPIIAAESVSTPALLKLCLRGLGVLPLPSSQASELRKTHHLIEFSLTDTVLCRNYYLIYHQSKYLTRGMHLFIQYLEEQFA